MRPPTLTIEYTVAGKTVRRKLGSTWICPLCTAELGPAGDRPVGISKQLACPVCKGTFRVVEIEMPDPKAGRPVWRRGPAPRPPSDKRGKRGS